MLIKNTKFIKVVFYPLEKTADKNTDNRKRNST